MNLASKDNFWWKTDQEQPQSGLTIRKHVDAQTLTSTCESLACLLTYGDILARGTKAIRCPKNEVGRL